MDSNITLKYRVHFSKIGWTDYRDVYDICHFDDLLIEAIQVCDDSSSINICALNSDGIIKMDSKGFVGTIGEKKPLYRFAISTNDNKYHYYYRVFFSKEGWSRLVRDGELVGTSDERPINGIQIIKVKVDESIEDIVKEANRRLALFEKANKQIFVNNKNKFLLQLSKDLSRKEDIKVKEVENGIILPLQIIEGINVRNSCYRGGVVDQNYNFVAGNDRKGQKNVNLSCVEGYKPNAINVINEEVIFGGIVYGFFGHALAESYSRFWWIVQHPEISMKIVLLIAPQTSEVNFDFLELLGISKERIIWLEEPTQFKKVYVPEQAIRLLKDYHPVYKCVYKTMGELSKGKSVDKIYLTRTHLKKNDGINEEYYETFFKKRGFTVIAPEEYSLSQQIKYISEADEVVCTLGTLSHLVVFAKKNAKFTIIRRCDDSILLAQIIMDQLSGIDIYYFDGTYNILPTQHAGGVFLYGPTQHFIDYLCAREIYFDEEEVRFNIQDYVYDYLSKWCDNYKNRKNYKAIEKCEMIDVINSISSALGREKVERKKII